MENKFRLCHGEGHCFCDDLNNLTYDEAWAILRDREDNCHLEVWDDEEGWVAV